jgi:LmbE family N-acetylglucosaminyl deacetylase
MAVPPESFPRPDLRDHTVLVLHAHPDDESIFTGITLRRLADAGARTVLVMATGGELGGSRTVLGPGETVRHRRLAELDRAAALLGVARVVHLGRRDSGLPRWGACSVPGSLAAADVLVLARRVAELAAAEGAATLVYDDEHGVYGHPDHRAVHRIGAAAAAMAGATGFLTTVDREHLHGSAGGRHLVQAAATAAAVPFGRTRAEIAVSVCGGARHLACKRAAMTAHGSQIGPGDLPVAGFPEVYGVEWFGRAGPRGVLDLLDDGHRSTAGGTVRDRPATGGRSQPARAGT